MSDYDGKLWYSKQQAERRKQGGFPPTMPGRLRDGRLVEYTEIKTGKHEDEPSLFDDAVYLGEGGFTSYTGQ